MDLGELYCMPDSSGEWIDKIKERIAKLYYSFGEVTKELPNGINVFNIMNLNQPSDKLGESIASFIVRSYIIKLIKKELDDGSKLTYTTPVNLFLDSFDKEFTVLINKEAIESIKTILNHTHFKGCSNRKEIEGKIPSVKGLNIRFNK